MYYIHKYQVSQEYGGSEEGGWWYQAGTPVTSALFSTPSEHLASASCRALNELERDRAKREEDYEYTSVLAHRSQHFAYDVSEDSVAKSYPETRPYYE